MKSHSILQFRLYIVGDAPNSLLAVANLREFCRIHLPGRHQFEIVDVLRFPKRALADRVYMTPTLIKLTPNPTRRVVGTLNQPEILLQAFGLVVLAA